MSEPLHMFYDPDAEEYVIAHSPDDATAVYVAQGLDLPDEGMRWKQLPPEKILKLYEDEPGSHFEQKTCAEWVAERGRSYWGSANY